MKDTDNPPPLQFTPGDSERANREWKASCGPHSLAAMWGMSLEQVRPFIKNFKGWMNPTMIKEALLRMEVSGAIPSDSYRQKWKLQTQTLCHGINRVQFEGAWTEPGADPREAYKHTHYVCRMGCGVYCTMVNYQSWHHIDDWRAWMASYAEPFHITHHWFHRR